MTSNIVRLESLCSQKQNTDSLRNTTQLSTCPIWAARITLRIKTALCELVKRQCSVPKVTLLHHQLPLWSLLVE